MEKKSATFAFGLIVLWCNGSTTVFGSVSGGSNPPGTTFQKQPFWLLWLGGLFFFMSSDSFFHEVFIVFFSFLFFSSIKWYLIYTYHYF